MDGPRDNLIYREESFAIMGACFEVYKHLGCGLPEAAYQEALEIEFPLRGIEAQPHPTLNIHYKGRKLVTHFIPDFICHDKIVLEIKAVPNLVKANEAQILGYLALTGHKPGLLANFGHFPLVEYQRFAN